MSRTLWPSKRPQRTVTLLFNSSLVKPSRFALNKYCRGIYNWVIQIHKYFCKTGQARSKALIVATSTTRSSSIGFSRDHHRFHQSRTWCCSFTNVMLARSFHLAPHLCTSRGSCVPPFCLSHHECPAWALSSALCTHPWQQQPVEFCCWEAAL